VKRRYQIEYAFDGRRKRSHIRGFCATLAGACASAVRHVARSEFDARDYKAAVILDRKTGLLVFKYHLSPETGTIVRKDFREATAKPYNIIRLHG